MEEWYDAQKLMGDPFWEKICYVINEIGETDMNFLVRVADPRLKTELQQLISNYKQSQEPTDEPTDVTIIQLGHYLQSHQPHQSDFELFHKFIDHLYNVVIYDSHVKQQEKLEILAYKNRIKLFISDFKHGGTIQRFLGDQEATSVQLALKPISDDWPFSVAVTHFALLQPELVQPALELEETFIRCLIAEGFANTT
jgi:hypothetical protein